MRAVIADDQQRVGVLYSTKTTSGLVFTVVQSAPAGASESAISVPAELRAAYWANGQLVTVCLDGEAVVIREVRPAIPAP